ncbi:hypothetical protein WL240_09395 [Staphylococcus epidermidis]|uniref:hypothetical protein n=2 Tax=Staphylococcus epidermidis TaxID=1282 RepID=UPI00119E1FE7|nr:hypothetical protein [Staphylococcus epidermidis]MCG2389270.1 hypothetical protein [Staphylococcus epidermidis]
MKDLKYTKKLFKESWYILINIVVAAIILVCFKLFNWSISKLIFKNASETDCISLDLAFLTPLLSLIIILIIGLIIDVFFNVADIQVLAENEEDTEIRLPAPNMQKDESKIIYIKIRIKRKIKKEKLVKVIIPYWYSFQPQRKQNIIVQKKGIYYINLAKINNTDSTGKYGTIIKCYVTSNDSGKEKNRINFECKNKGVILNDDSIIFRQLKKEE